MRSSEHLPVMSDQAMNFGPFRIDTVHRRLYRDEAVVDIPPRAFAVLFVLLERRGQTVGKQELMDAVWPNTAVEENNLARSISTLRKVLGEKPGEHKYILTMPGIGYSFVGVDPPADSAVRASPRLRLGRSAEAIAACASLCGAALLWMSIQARPVERLEQVRFRPVLSSHSLPAATLSPDGKAIAYGADAPGQQSVRLRQIGAGREVELISASDRSYSAFVFAPDGESLFLLAAPSPGKANVLVRVPVSGGPAAEIAHRLDSPVTVSRDGSRIAFVREADGESVLIEQRLAGGGETRLAATKLPVYLDYPAWSPDARSIAYSEVTPDGVFLRELDVRSRRERRIGQRWRHLRRFSWRPRSDGFLVSGIESGGGRFKLFRVSRDTGAATPLTENMDSLHHVIASMDGTRALTVAERSLAAVWAGTPGGAGQWRQLSPPSDNVVGVSWITDGILLERSMGNGHSFHLVSPDGGEQKEVLPPGPHSSIRVCRDGDKLVYYSALADRAGLWVREAGGGASSRLLAVSTETNPECLADSIWFVSRDPRWWPGLWSMPIDGGQPKLIDKRAGLRYAVSPDGRYAAYLDQDDVASPQKEVTQLVVDALDGSGAVKRFELTTGLARLAPLRWIPGEPSITWAGDRAGVSEIWEQSLEGGPARQLTSFSGGTIRSFDWSPNGKQLVVSRAMQSFELLLLEFGR